MRCSRKLPCANCPSISYFVHNCEEKLHMPLGNKTRKAPLTKDNLTHLLDVIKPVKNGEQHLGLLLLIADMLDCIANGEEWYMVIGSTKSNDAFSVTITSGADKEYVFGSSLSDLSIRAHSLL
jgi:hypothetical protein